MKQPLGDLPGFGPVDVERQAALIAVDLQELRALAVAERRPVGTGVVAVERLHLHHTRSGVAEQHATVRAGQPLRQLDDT